MPLRDAKSSFLGHLESFGVDYPNHSADKELADTFPASDPPAMTQPGHEPEPEVEKVAVAVAVAEHEPRRVRVDDFELTDGSVVIAAITSCTNTSNPQVMVGAGPAREERRSSAG